ncbi:unnamed protein product [Zymoseptoria tritici ST99CH_1A5]|uniref:Hydrophobin n=1 Tax=Zymoseptoria tritici ST99CH_1A5 TaxID=1276529 RepID=A0A1Y6LV27_ZYMTR|nr:unnamed protein product [Zymoseptoria tritici ST99CH_1A5]
MRSILQGLLACAFAVAVQAKCVSNGNVNDICASADNCCGSPGLDCFQDGPHKRCHTACAEGYDDGGTYGRYPRRTFFKRVGLGGGDGPNRDPPFWTLASLMKENDGYGFHSASDVAGATARDELAPDVDEMNLLSMTLREGRRSPDCAELSASASAMSAVTVTIAATTPRPTAFRTGNTQGVILRAPTNSLVGALATHSVIARARVVFASRGAVDGKSSASIAMNIVITALSSVSQQLKKSYIREIRPCSLFGFPLPACSDGSSAMEIVFCARFPGAFAELG